MAVRVQVILDSQEAALFRERARRESKSLSAWLREAGRMAIERQDGGKSLKQVKALKEFFRMCNQEEKGGTEEEWEDLKRMIGEGYRGADL